MWTEGKMDTLIKTYKASHTKKNGLRAELKAVAHADLLSDHSLPHAINPTVLMSDLLNERNNCDLIEREIYEYVNTLVVTLETLKRTNYLE